MLLGLRYECQKQICGFLRALTMGVKKVCAHLHKDKCGLQQFKRVILYRLNMKYDEKS